MAKGQNQLMQCPNFSTCGTMVLANKRGEPHRYGVWNAQLEKMEYFTCNGG